MTRHSPIFRHFKNYSLMLTQLVKKISAAILVYGTSGTRTHFRCVFLNSLIPKTMETIPHTLILRQTQNLAHLTAILAAILFYDTSGARTHFRCVFLNSPTPKTMETIPHTHITPKTEFGQFDCHIGRHLGFRQEGGKIELGNIDFLNQRGLLPLITHVAKMSQKMPL